MVKHTEFDQDMRAAAHLAYSHIEKVAVPPRPKGGILLEATRSGVKEGNIPIFTVSQILNIPADQELMVPLMDRLAPPRFIPSPRPELMKVLHDNRRLIVPDYKIDGYVTKDTSLVPFAEIERLTGAVEWEINHEELQTLAKRNRGAISPAVIEKTDKATRERIQQLVGTGNEIKNTYRVGNVQATEVVPQKRVDPLFCVRISDHRLDGSMNRLFESAFVKAMAGRIGRNEKALQQAVKLGEVAGRTAFNSCCGGARWSFAELLFVSEIVYSDGQFLANGFARLSL